MRNNETYKKYAETKPEQPIEDIVEEVTVEPEQPIKETIVETESVDPKMGIVTDCLQLNVREEPDADATILCTITLGTNVEIDEIESTEDFYKIYTASGIEGFCMKKFIAV